MIPSSRGFSVCAHGWRAAVLADCAETHDVLDRYVLPWLPRSAVDRGQADAVFEVSRSAAGLALWAGGRLLAASTTAEGLIPSLEACLDEAIVRVTDAVPVHAGAAAWNGAAVLIPGPSHAGKSTLIRELLSRGFTYFSDEYALIDRQGRLHPYPRALMLRDANGVSRPALASDCGGRVAEAPARVALIMTIVYVPDGGWMVDRVPQSAMLVELLKHTPRTLGERRDIVRPLAAAASAARCYAGTRGSAREAADRIAALLEHPA